VKAYENELKRINENLKQKLEELEFWKGKYQNYDFDSHQKDEKIVLLSNEIERL